MVIFDLQDRKLRYIFFLNPRNVGTFEDEHSSRGFVASVKVYYFKVFLFLYVCLLVCLQHVWVPSEVRLFGTGVAGGVSLLPTLRVLCENSYHSFTAEL